MQCCNGFLHRTETIRGDQGLSSLTVLGSADGNGLDLARRLFSRDDGDEFIFSREELAVL